MVISVLPLSLFLNTGTMFASFHSSGTAPRCNDLLNNLHREGTMMGAVSFSNFAGVPSGPVALFIVKTFKC